MLLTLCLWYKKSVNVSMTLCASDYSCIYVSISQGSEELFMLDPMPTRSSGSTDVPSSSDHPFISHNQHNLHSPVPSPSHPGIDTQEDRVSLHDEPDMSAQNIDEVSSNHGLREKGYLMWFNCIR